MLKKVLGTIWRRAPRSLRRTFSRFAHERFTATAGAVVTDDQGRVLLLKHVFRPGSGWGIPGGFIEKSEQPAEALRRELREEVALELDSVELAFVRILRDVRQLEVVFCCRSKGEARPQSVEIAQAGWFSLSALPDSLSDDQRQLINRALSDGAKRQS